MNELLKHRAVMKEETPPSGMRFVASELMLGTKRRRTRAAMPALTFS